MAEDPEIYEGMGEMYHKEDWKYTAKVYGVAFAVVIVVIMPWAIGVCMIAKWILKALFF